MDEPGMHGRSHSMGVSWQVRRAGLGFVVIMAVTSAAFSQQAAKTKPAETSKTVKAESVTINMPEGMTKDQADAILNELKAIHQLLQSQQSAAAAKATPAPAPVSEKVQMKWLRAGTRWAATTLR